jgi:predicted phosphoribosyltransferase
MQQSVFRDRSEAGRLLAERVALVVGTEGVLVLGLPRGGVAVASEIARRLGAPLDVFVVRKLEVSDASSARKRKVAVGVIAAGGVRVLDSTTIEKLEIPLGKVEEAARAEALELARLERYYRGHRQSPKMMGREIVLVDDGLSPAPSLRAAADALAAYRPARVVVALPAASADVCADIRERVGTVICARPTETAGVAANLYEDESISNREVRHLLAEAGAREHGQQLAG